MASTRACASGMRALRRLRPPPTTPLPSIASSFPQHRLSSTKAVPPPPVSRNVRDGEPSDGDAPPSPAKPRSFMDRLIAPDDSGQSPVLRMLGYYTPESKAIGAANSLYGQILGRSRAAVANEYTSEHGAEFLPQYEMMSVHVYLTLLRLRSEKGSPFESDVEVAMQTLFDTFWADVRKRMMVEENNLPVLVSAKWIKQCERNFFAMAVAFDEAWEDEKKMLDAISTHLKSLKTDPRKLKRLRSYMMRERTRLDTVTINQVWEGVCWDPQYPVLLN